MVRPAVAQDIVCALRHQIAKIEGVLPERLEAPETRGIVSQRAGRHVAATFSTGASRFDMALGGGLPAAGLVEVHGAATRGANAVAGFVLGMVRRVANTAPVIWIGTREIFREAGWPYLPGLVQRFGLSPQQLLLAQAEKLSDVLWIAEEAAALAPLAGILLEIRGNPSGLDLTATRRLHRRALMAGHPLFLMRQASYPEPTAAPLRLMVEPAPAGHRLTLKGPLQGSIGPPAFRVTIDKSRTSPPATFLLEWNGQTRAFEERDHAHASKNPGALVSVPADGAHLSPTFREVVALPSPAGNAAARHQSSRKQRPAHRLARRAG